MFTGRQRTSPRREISFDEQENFFKSSVLNLHPLLFNFKLKETVYSYGQVKLGIDLVILGQHVL